MPDLFEAPETPERVETEERLSPLALGARHLLADANVWGLHQRMYEGTLSVAIRAPDPAAREEGRLKFLALEALFEELQRIARGEVTEQDAEAAQLAVEQRRQPNGPVN